MNCQKRKHLTRSKKRKERRKRERKEGKVKERRRGRKKGEKRGGRGGKRLVVVLNPLVCDVIITNNHHRTVRKQSSRINRYADAKVKTTMRSRV